MIDDYVWMTYTHTPNTLVDATLTSHSAAVKTLPAVRL